MPVVVADNSTDPPGVLISLKAVPGAKRTEVVGLLGERLKVRVAAPPEDGRANTAIRELLAAELGVRAANVEITRGHTSAEKTVRVKGVSLAAVEARYGPRSA
jgi:uncharacterized protein